jgi:hypothetical protein
MSRSRSSRLMCGGSLNELTDGTSNTLLLGEFGRGPQSIGMEDWFAG